MRQVLRASLLLVILMGLFNTAFSQYGLIPPSGGIKFGQYYITGAVSVGKGIASTTEPRAYPPRGAWFQIGTDTTTKGYVPPKVVDTSIIPVADRVVGLTIWCWSDTAFHTWYQSGSSDAATGRWYKWGAYSESGGIPSLQQVAQAGNKTDQLIWLNRIRIADLSQTMQVDSPGATVAGWSATEGIIQSRGMASVAYGVSIDSGLVSASNYNSVAEGWASGGLILSTGYASYARGTAWQSAAYGLKATILSSGAASIATGYAAQLVPSNTKNATIQATSSSSFAGGLCIDGSIIQSIDGATFAWGNARDSTTISATENSAVAIGATEQGGEIHSDGGASFAGGMGNKGLIISGIGAKGKFPGTTTHGSFIWASTYWYTARAMSIGEGSAVFGLAQVDSLVAWDSVAFTAGMNVKNYGKYAFAYGTGFRNIEHKTAKFGWDDYVNFKVDGANDFVEISDRLVISGSAASQDSVRAKDSVGAVAIGKIPDGLGNITASSAAAIARGYSYNFGFIQASGLASSASGYSIDSAGIQATGRGASASGNAISGNFIKATGVASEASGMASHATGVRQIKGVIQATNEGAKAWGAVYSGTIQATGFGATAFGLTQASGAIPVGGIIQATSIASFATGTSSTGSTISSQGQGSIAGGSAITYGNITALSTGSFAWGRSRIGATISADDAGFAIGMATDTGTLKAGQFGSFAQGAAFSGSQIRAGNSGSMARGYGEAYGKITSEGIGATVMGYSSGVGSSLRNQSAGFGSLVGGYALNGDSVYNSGLASVVWGRGIKNTGNYSYIFGEGLNTVTNTANGRFIFAAGGSKALMFDADNALLTIYDESDTFALLSQVRSMIGGSTAYVQNQNSSAQSSTNFWIDGTGTAANYIATSAGQPTIQVINTNSTTQNFPALNLSVTGQNGASLFLVPKDAPPSTDIPFVRGSRGTALLVSSPGNMYYTTLGGVTSPTTGGDHVFYINAGSPPLIDSAAKFDKLGGIYFYHIPFSSAKDTVSYWDTSTGQLKRTRIPYVLGGAGTPATTDATPVEIDYDVPTGEVGVYNVTVTAINAANESVSWDMLATLKDVAGTASLVGSPVTVANPKEAGITAATAVITASGTNLRLTLTGIAATNITWSYKIVKK